MKLENKLSTTYDIKMVTELFNLMKKKMPKFDIAYDQENHCIYSSSCIHHKDSPFSFHIQIRIFEDNYLSIMFYFGDVPLNSRNLYTVNEINEKSFLSYKAYLRRKKNDIRTAFFDIEYNKTIKDAKEAYHCFHEATNYLNNDEDMTFLLTFLLKPNSDNKEVDYKIMN